MKTRILSAIFIVGPLLIFLFLGGIPLLVFCLAISAVGMHEFYKGYEHIDVHAGKYWSFGMLAALYIIIGIALSNDELKLVGGRLGGNVEGVIAGTES